MTLDPARRRARAVTAMNSLDMASRQVDNARKALNELGSAPGGPVDKWLTDVAAALRMASDDIKKIEGTK